TSRSPPRSTSSPKVKIASYPTISGTATDLHFDRPTRPITDKDSTTTNERAGLGTTIDRHSTSASASGSNAESAPVGQRTEEDLDREIERLQRIQAHAIRKPKRKFQPVEFDSDIEDPG